MQMFPCLLKVVLIKGMKEILNRDLSKLFITDEIEVFVTRNYLVGMQCKTVVATKKGKLDRLDLKTVGIP